MSAMDAIETLAARACQISAAGQFDPQDGSAVPSPCIDICRLAPDRSHCEGCLRSLDDIRAWGKADAEQRRAIWRRLLQRAGIATPQGLA